MSPVKLQGGHRYIPIRDFDVDAIKQEAFREYREVGDVIEDQAEELAKILAQNEEGDLHDTLTYSIREIMRNVVEHSQSQKIHVCAQYWPTYRTVEVGIVDDGVGIHAALTKNPVHAALSEKEAVEMSLMPGISGNPLAGLSREIWSNSGYGLYLTNRICRNGGSFLICSNNQGIELDQNGKSNFETNFKGTAIRLFINTDHLGELQARLKLFADEGRVAAKELIGANESRASTASHMLRRDFQEK